MDSFSIHLFRKSKHYLNLNAMFDNQNTSDQSRPFLEEFLLYADIVESFFIRNFPLLDRQKFWSWFLKMLTGNEHDINNLSEKEVEDILNKLKLWEGGLLKADIKMPKSFNQ